LSDNTKNITEAVTEAGDRWTGIQVFELLQATLCEILKLKIRIKKVVRQKKTEHNVM